MNIDEIKKECQITTHNYIVGLKFVTTETVCTNATPAIYYFTEQSTIFEEVLNRLKKICKENKLGITKITEELWK